MDQVSEVGKFVVNNAPELVGFILPPIIDFINKDVYGDDERAIIAILVCLIVAVVLKWNSLIYDSPLTMLVSFGLIFTESQGIFRLYFKNSFTRSFLQSLYLNPEI